MTLACDDWLNLASYIYVLVSPFIWANAQAVSCTPACFLVFAVPLFSMSGLQLLMPLPLSVLLLFVAAVRSRACN